MTMFLTLSPRRSDVDLKLERYGDILTFNGQAVNLSTVPVGGDGFDPEWQWITGPVTRNADGLHVTILAPFGPDATNAAKWPEPLTVTADGPVALPE